MKIVNNYVKVASSDWNSLAQQMKLTGKLIFYHFVPSEERFNHYFIFE